MARKALVEIVGDATSFARSLKESVRAADQFGNKLKEVSVDAKRSAEVQVQASVKKDARLREEIVAYKAVAAAAAKGSREQIAAANLAAKGQARLASSLAVTTHESRALAAASNNAERDFARLSRGALVGTGALKGLGRAAAFASTSFIGGAGIVYGLKALVAAQSEVQEETEKTGVVFGRNAAQIQAWAGTLSSSFGVSRAEALKSAGTFGNMLVPLHFGTDVAASMSKRLVELAADMASFNNASPATVLAAISGGLAGQVRPLRQYGVFLTAARIQQEAWSDGIAKTGTKLTTHQKVLAAYNIILKDTKNAQGDVARNTSSLSVAWSKLTAAISDTESGNNTLLKQITDMTNRAAVWLGDSKHQKQIQNDLASAARGTAEAVKGLAAVVRTLLMVTKPAVAALGGLKSTGEILGATFAAVKFSKMIGGLAEIGFKSKVASGEMSVLRSRLIALRTLGTIGVTIAVGVELSKEAQRFSKWLGGTAGGSALGLGDTPLPKGVSFDQAAAAMTAAKEGKATPSQQALLNRIAVLQKKNKPFAAPSGPGLSDAASSGGFTAARTTAAPAPPPLTASQRLKIALAANPNDLAALGQQATADRGAIAFLKKRLANNKIDNATYVKLVTQAYNDLTSTEATITSIEQADASKAAEAARKREAAAKKAAAARVKAAKAAKAAIQSRQFEALGLGPKGTGQSPLKETLGKELARVKAQLKGTLLDTDKNTHLLTQVGKVLDGQFGALTDKTRAAVRKLLDTLDNELKKKKSGFGPLGRVVSAESLTKGIGFASTAARIEQETRIAQALAHGGRVPTAMSLQGQPVVVHTKVHLDGREVGRSVTTHQQKAARHRATQTSGINAGRGWGG